MWGWRTGRRVGERAARLAEILIRLQYSITPATSRVKQYKTRDLQPNEYAPISIRTKALQLHPQTSIPTLSADASLPLLRPPRYGGGDQSVRQWWKKLSLDRLEGHPGECVSLRQAVRLALEVTAGLTTTVRVRCIARRHKRGAAGLVNPERIARGGRTIAGTTVMTKVRSRSVAALPGSGLTSDRPGLSSDATSSSRARRERSGHSTLGRATAPESRRDIALRVTRDLHRALIRMFSSTDLLSELSPMNDWINKYADARCGTKLAFRKASKADAAAMKASLKTGELIVSYQ